MTGLFTRRRLMTSAACFAGLTAGKVTMAQDFSGKPPLLRAALPPEMQETREFRFESFPELDFRTISPTGFEWFEAPEEVNDFDASGMFTEFRREWLGYEPSARDELEVSVYCARIPPERVAVALDYAGADRRGLGAIGLWFRWREHGFRRGADG